MFEKRDSSVDFVLQPRKKQLFVKDYCWAYLWDYT